ncbi:MAG: hypothetical protein FJ309_09770 [Planctomycetes bacterium]|nr:hypothetical protein [Planctomycetota bacterium]
MISFLLAAGHPLLPPVLLRLQPPVHLGLPLLRRQREERIGRRPLASLDQPHHLLFTHLTGNVAHLLEHPPHAVERLGVGLLVAGHLVEVGDLLIDERLELGDVLRSREPAEKEPGNPDGRTEQEQQEENPEHPAPFARSLAFGRELPKGTPGVGSGHSGHGSSPDRCGGGASPGRDRPPEGAPTGANRGGQVVLTAISPARLRRSG